MQRPPALRNSPEWDERQEAVRQLLEGRSEKKEERVSELVPQSPLMQPVFYQGQEYFTSQYFHTQYVTNSPHGGKYRRHDSFLRLLRSIETYNDYVAQEAIVELPYKQAKTYQHQNGVSDFTPLFQAAGYRPLTLLNATAQVELSHHLDDELSKQLAVAASTMVARQMTKQGGRDLLPLEKAEREALAGFRLSKLFHVPEHIAQQEVVKLVEQTTGVNLRSLMLVAPAQNDITPDDEMLEPTDLAKRFAMPSGIAANRALEQIGWQVKRIGGGWEPTPVGRPYAATHAFTANHGAKHGYNLRWRLQAVREAFRQHGMLTTPQEGA